MAEYCVHSAGFPGNNSRQLLERLDQEVLARRPKLVVMMMGSNDVLNSFNSVPLDEYRANLEAIVAKLKAAGIQVMVMTIPPCYEPYVLARHKPEFFADESPMQKVTAAVREIRGVADKFALPVVELNTILSRLGNIGTSAGSLLRNEANSGAADGVHPTAEGYRMIAAAVYQAIVDHKLPREQIVCYGDSITFGVHVQGEGTTEGETYPAQLARLLAQ